MNDQQILITKSTGEKEPFDVAKLEQSLMHARASVDVIQKVIDHIVSELKEGMTTQEIYKHAFSLLKKLEKPIAARYSLRRSIMELGPTGFPFERFVAEIFKARGFEAITDQMVYGGCVEHEVDVVAWNDKELVMAEVKFHHQLGLKSDLKVALYVKARMDDLKLAQFNYGGKERPMTDGQLITNTKFTITAVKYAKCQGLTIIGWNYPIKGNLHDLIDEARLHPITCLDSLTTEHKRQLIEKNIVLCKTVRENSGALREIGLSPSDVKAVEDEIATLA